MCIITLIDTQPDIIDSRDVKQLTLANSLLGNFDGFGYYLFNGKFSKAKEETALYWRENYIKFMKENKIFNGIYHVRKSSPNYVTPNTSTISDDKSHPFDYNDIIVAHNGFLTFRYSHIDSDKYEKEIRGDLIDSQKFAKVLSMICDKGKVTFDNIKDALNLFSGGYALAIKGKKDNFVWLIRGKDRTLWNMTLFSGETKVGTIINTATFSQILLGETLLDYGLDYELKELTENTAYKYTLGSYEVTEVNKIMQDSTFEANKVSVASQGVIVHNHSLEEKTVYEDILELMYGMGLLSSDLMILSELIFNKPLLILDAEEYRKFKELLEKLKNEAHDSRINLWKEILQHNKGNSVYKLYIDNDIQYPYFMNTKDELKNFLHNFSKKEIKNELSIVQ